MPFEIPDASKLSEWVGATDVLPSFLNLAGVSAMDTTIAAYTLLGQKPSAWTTEDYAFCPARLQGDLVIETNSTNSKANWSFATIGIHARKYTYSSTF